MLTKTEKKKRMKAMAAMKAAKHQKVLYPFTEKTRLYDLIKAEYHTTLAAWLELISPYLEGGGIPNWKTCRRLNFNCSTSEAARCIAWLLLKIGDDGLKYSKTVFLRFVTTKEHSSISVQEKSFISLVNNWLRYLQSPMFNIQLTIQKWLYDVK